eukprot:TRINITY_DN4434_c0_g1_i1.p2 TRINITY_DN4434_c0_g1~~TRINITY_DN4434_c0_g1_i1.p2  ORF type:complete len:108 (-),score=24.22 TRINITY_DN4434_c0_g1_i1:5-328(-)
MEMRQEYTQCLCVANGEEPSLDDNVMDGGGVGQPTVLWIDLGQTDGIFTLHQSYVPGKKVTLEDVDMEVGLVLENGAETVLGSVFPQAVPVSPWVFMVRVDPPCTLR